MINWFGEWVTSFWAMQITRKKFVGQLSGLLTGAGFGLGLFKTRHLLSGHSVKQLSSASMERVKILPLAGENYSPSFLRWCQRSEFATAQEAISRVKNRRVRYQLARGPNFAASPIHPQV